MADIKKMLNIISNNGGSPGDKLTREDSTNVNIGLVHGYAQDLGKQIMNRKMAESMQEMEREAADKTYLSKDRKHTAAMEVMSALLDARKNKKSPSDIKLSPIADALYKGFIQRASNDAIANKSHGQFMETGAGITKIF